MGDTTFGVSGASVGLDYTSPYDNLSLMLSVDYMKTKLKPWLTLNLGTRIKTDFGHQRSPLEVLQNLAQDRGALASLLARPGVTLSDPSAHGTDNAISGDYEERVVMPLGWDFLHLDLKFDPFENGALIVVLPELALGVDWVNILGKGQLNFGDKPGKEICTTGVADPNGTPKGPGSEASAPPKTCKTGDPTPVAPNMITRDENKGQISRRVGFGIASNFTTSIFSASVVGGYYGVGDRNGGYVTSLLDFHAPEKNIKPASLQTTAVTSQVSTGESAAYTVTVNQPGNLEWWILDTRTNTIIPGSPNHNDQQEGVSQGQNRINVPTKTAPAGTYKVRFVFTPKDDATDTKEATETLEVKDPAPVVEATELSADPTATAIVGNAVFVNVQSNKTGDGTYKFNVAGTERTGDFRIVTPNTPTRINIRGTSDLVATTPGNEYKIEFQMDGVKSTTALTMNPETEETTTKTPVVFSLNRTVVSSRGKLDVTIKTPGLYKITISDIDITSDLGIIEIINYDSNDPNGKIIIPNPRESGKNAKIVRLNLTKVPGLDAGKTYDVVVTPVGRYADTLEASTHQFTVSGRTGTTGRRPGRGTTGK